ncbi:hypothetical protein TrVFT333_006999 [Trichoderma virens FT-333]|nr:hypothetical protein TrVFT333_006999 [Trichoderma virens FT-333]
MGAWDLFGTPEPVDTEDIHNLLTAVLLSFIEVGQDFSAASDDKSTATLGFYIRFTRDAERLHRYLTACNPTEIVSRLEDCFLSGKGKGAEYLRLGLEKGKDTYPRLRALRRILSEDEDIFKGFGSKLNSIGCMDPGNAEKKELF